MAECFIFSRINTNADRIRSMSDEEMAWEIMEWRFDAYGKATGSKPISLVSAGNYNVSEK